MDFKLHPFVAKESPQFAAYVADQFKRITDAFKFTRDSRYGIASVTGTAIVATGLTKVEYCQASFNADPSLANIALSIRPHATAGSIFISTFAWSNTWAPTLIPSVTTINVNWVAFGF